MRVAKINKRINRASLLGTVCLFLLISCSTISIAPTANVTLSKEPDNSSYLFDKTSLLFIGTYNQEGSGIFILDPNAKYITKVPSELAETSHWASLSANGRGILFDSQGDIFLADLTTGDVKLLISDPFLDSKPIWSPTGEQFAFERDNGASICTGDSSGLVETLLSAEPDKLFNIGNWSPDGEEIVYAEMVFASGQEGVPIAPDTHIMIVNIETGQSRPLFNVDPPFDFNNPMNPVFSPDGKIVAFQAKSDGHVRIFQANIDGGNVTEITTTPGDYSNPVWSPDGQYILAFTGGDVENYYSIFSSQEGNLVHTIHGLDGLIPEWFLSK